MNDKIKNLKKETDKTIKTFLDNRKRVNRCFKEKNKKRLRVLMESKEEDMSVNSITTENSNFAFETSSLSEIRFGDSFKLYMNYLVQYPKNLNLKHLATFRDFTCDRNGPAEAALFASFGFEKEFLTPLLEYAKVNILIYIKVDVFINSFIKYT